MEGEFQDWEVLQDSDGSSPRGLEGIEGESEGVIRSDYFSLDSQNKYAKADGPGEDDGSFESDNPSWIDPGLETRDPGDFWSDSGSDRSGERRSTDFQAKTESCLSQNENSQMDLQGVGESEGVEGKEEPGSAEMEKSQVGFEGIGEIAPVVNGSDQFLADSVETSEAVVDSGVTEDTVSEGMKPSGELDKRRIAWWKAPLELLKYCAFRLSPVWSISVAAAVMGVVILGRRLYRMKRKSRGLQLKVTVDDKKVSQFMSRAARLNEAFSVVRRVPIIRPALPAAGVTPWPVVSLR